MPVESTELTLPPLDIGRLWGSPTPVKLGYEQLSVHMAVLGGSGSGKSKFLELLMRQLMEDRHGFAFIDPHGDTARDLLAFAAARKADGDDKLWRRIHYLKVGADSSFAFDPFAHLPRRTEVSKTKYESLLNAKVNRVCLALLRRVAEADLEVMNRLKKWLKNILYVCGTSYDDENSHIGLDKMLVFTHPANPGFMELLRRVWDFLPFYVQKDFHQLIETKSEVIRDKLESTDNRLRDILSPLVQGVLSQRAPSLNVLEIIRNRGFLIADMGETPDWSFDHKVTLGGLLIDEVLLAKQAEEQAKKDNRIPFALIIDESGEFLGEDLKRALGATRKYRLPIILAAQDLSTFAKGDFDMAPKVLSMCQTVVCFQNTYRPDKEILEDRIGAGDTDFTERLREEQRQRGYILLEIPEESFGTTQNQSISSGLSASWGKSENLIRSEAIALTEGHSDTSSWGQTDTETNTRGSMHGLSDATSQDRHATHGDRHVRDTRTRSGSESSGQARGKSSTNNSSVSNQRSVSNTQTKGRGEGKSSQLGLQAGRSQGMAQSYTVSLKKTLLPNLVSEMERTGDLEHGSVADQRERRMQTIHCLSVAQALVCIRGIRNSLGIKVHTVPEEWEANDKEVAIARLRAKLRELHPYYFNPEEVSAQGEPAPSLPFPWTVAEPAQPPARRNVGNFAPPVGDDPYSS